MTSAHLYPKDCCTADPFLPQALNNLTSTCLVILQKHWDHFCFSRPKKSPKWHDIFFINKWRWSLFKEQNVDQIIKNYFTFDFTILASQLF